jgi:sulfur carrier protein ThiS
MQATLTIIHNPFHPARSREQRCVASPVTIADLAPATKKPFICIRNGQPLMRRDWQQQIADADVIAFVTLPQGGGDGGSNPMQFVLMVAVMWVAGPAASGLLGPGASAGMFGAVKAGLIMAGSMLVNALIPPPKLPATQQAAALAAPSPTYSLQSQGNYARLDAAIPVQYGRLKLFPDFAAQPYAEYQGNEQFLYQLFCIGQGEFDLESINIEDTPITSWDEITWEVVEPGGTLSLFPSNVVTSGEVTGQDLAGVKAATYSRSGTTTVTVTETGHGRAIGQSIYFDATAGTATDGAFTIATVPTLDTYTFTHTAAGTDTAQACNIHTYGGPFVASAAATDANALGIDIILTRGLYEYDTTTGAIMQDSVSFVSEAQEIDDGGTAVGAWTELEAVTITAATTTPQRYSYRYPLLLPGRYQVRMRRTDAKRDGTNIGNDLVWGGLRAYLPETTDFGNVTLLAMRMKATNNLSQQASRKINLVATRKIKTWDPTTGWSASTVASRSIAWALADALKDTEYGAGLADSRVDLAALYDLDQVWSGRSDTFDGRFDNVLTLWDALTQIAQAGRAKPYLQGGIVHFARDAEAPFPVALYSMRNIVRGSFNIDYILPSEETADAVEVSYLDAATWTQQMVPAYLTGSARDNPAKVSLFGVTDREQAYREGMYQAASSRYRRRIIKFNTEMEGFLPSFGDLIAISHDMPGWGRFAEAVAWDGGTLTLSEPVDTYSSFNVGLRRKDGSVDGPYAVTSAGDASQVTFAAAPATTPYTGSAWERTHVVFGSGETWRQPARVIAVRPRGLYQVEIEAINEDASVHTADSGVTAPAIVYSQLSTIYTAPGVVGLTGASLPGDPTIMLLSWQQAPGADYYIVEQSQDSTDWTRVAETRASNYSGRALYGAATVIRVAAVGLTRGPWVTWYYGDSSDYMWTSDTALMWDVDDTTPMWRY